MLGEWPLRFSVPGHSHGNIVCLRSRLTLGLMGLDELHLRVLAASSENRVERANAKTGLYTLSL